MQPHAAAIGVRDGDPAALDRLVDERGPAVLAYCTEVCPPELVARAAAESFARYRAAVHDALDPAAIDHELVLLGATRHAAASMARTTPPAPGRQRRNTCPVVPVLLAARESGALGPDDRDRLARHLARCEGCRDVEASFRRAERLFRDPPPLHISDSARATILAALEAAVPPEAVEHPTATEEWDSLAAAQADPGPEPVVYEPDAPTGEHDVPAEEHDPAPLRTVASFPSPQTGSHEVPSGTRRRFGVGRVTAPRLDGRMLLPVGVVVAALVAALAAAGVFGGDEAAPPVERTDVVARDVEPPVTTPLPVTVPVEREPAPEETEEPNADPGAGTTPQQDTAPPEEQTAPPGQDDTQGAAPEDDAGGRAEAGTGTGGGGTGSEGGEGTVFEPDQGSP